ncbi:Helix-turn-helix domain-containing protein [Actinokineospora alba]|uniref:Helix-turn-helix domain-containing protein n=1 Tax=Actinokineospora alba TaxID=504798 RepID=A0A1H0SNX8_9PSEU|nr:helix-turn-helix transcriptional regulator [Actinokineospora alba]TDP66612.1 helix-turn-helix protein [Actinokineospora alba]SDJ38868.1 Helix-turn-helix domain-containing protein [Actinokineospora alba]SDP43461.1 Helix-turn-helix domain-containing protein [Actinokineospora alba]
MGARNRAGARELGDLLRGYREAAGLTLRQLSPKLGYSTACLHRLETGYRGTTTETEVVHYMAACGAHYKDVRKLIDACRATNDDRGYWLCPHGQWMGDSLRSLIFHESSASKSVSYEPELIPGLLQTEAYARALFARADISEEHRAARVQARMERQRILFRNNPAKFIFFIQERALRLEVGTYRIMTEQLLAMLFLADQWNISIRIVPASARDRASLGGPFQLFGFHKYRTLAYLDGPVGGLFLEDLDYVGAYRSLNRQLAGLALDAGESRVLLAKLADEYDRAEGSWDDASQVAQEQL